MYLLATRIASALWPYAAGAVLAVAVIAYLEHRGAEKERAAQFARDVAAYKASADLSNKTAVQLEKQLAAMTEENNQLNKELENEKRRDPVYAACRVPADGVRLYSRARQSTSAR